MSPIQRVVARASRRLLMIDVLATLAVTASVVVAALLVTLSVEKLGPPMSLPWPWLFAIGAALAFVAALIWSIVRRPSSLAVARAVDDRAQLRETLSTAMVVSNNTDPWSQAVVTSAERTATTVDVDRTLPLTWSRLWSVPAALGAALLVVWWLPGYDLTGRAQQLALEEDNKAQINTVTAEVRAEQEQLDAMMREAGLDIEDGLGDMGFEDVQQAASTPDDVRRAALRKLTNVTEKLQREQEGAKGQEMAALRDAFRQLRAPGQGPMTEMSRQLARGNFSEAKKLAEQIQQQLDNGEMNSEQRQQMSEALRQMSDTMNALAQDQSALKQAMQQAGMSAEQAQQALQNPQNMQQAIQQMQNLTPEQQQQLQQMAQGMQNAQQSMSAMASAMDQMAQQCENPGASQGGQSGGQQLSQQLSDAEMLQNSMDNLQQAMQMAQSQMQNLGNSMCENPGSGGGQNPGGGMGEGPGQTGRFSQGETGSKGSGSGGPGQGDGASPDSEATDFALKRERDNVANQGGPIIGSTVVFGAQVRGETTQTFRTAISAAEANASEAIETMAVPPEYHQSVKHYFGTMESDAGNTNTNTNTGTEAGTNSSEGE